MPITRDESILGGDPRLDGTRIGVIHVYELVVDGDHAPADVADQLDISLGDVYEALAYYYHHPDEMREIEREYAASDVSLAQRALPPPELIE